MLSIEQLKDFVASLRNNCADIELDLLIAFKEACVSDEEISLIAPDLADKFEQLAIAMEREKILRQKEAEENAGIIPKMRLSEYYNYIDKAATTGDHLSKWQLWLRSPKNKT